jgi:hypothetical protein
MANGNSIFKTLMPIAYNWHMTRDIVLKGQCLIPVLGGDSEMGHSPLWVNCPISES